MVKRLLVKAGRAVRKFILETRERRTCIMDWLLAVATWRLEMISNKVANLAEVISRQNVRCQLAYFSCL